MTVAQPSLGNKQHVIKVNPVAARSLKAHRSIQKLCLFLELPLVLLGKCGVPRLYNITTQASYEEQIHHLCLVSMISASSKKHVWEQEPPCPRKDQNLKLSQQNHSEIQQRLTVHTGRVIKITQKKLVLFLKIYYLQHLYPVFLPLQGN